MKAEGIWNGIGRSSALVLIWSLLGSGCGRDMRWMNRLSQRDTIVGSGIAATETIEVEPFRAIELKCAGEVTVTTGETFTVTLTTDDNLLPIFKREVVNQTLQLYTNESWKTQSGIQFVITAPAIDQVTVSGSGNMKITGIAESEFQCRISGSGSLDIFGTSGSLNAQISGSGHVRALDLHAESTSVNISGSGSITLAGSSEFIEAEISGSGQIDAVQLISMTATARITGSGSIRLNASSSLDGHVGGSGNIQYTGSPANISKKITGSGAIVPIQ
jgi:hypothetical protein